MSRLSIGTTAAACAGSAVHDHTRPRCDRPQQQCQFPAATCQGRSAGPGRWFGHPEGGYPSTVGVSRRYIARVCTDTDTSLPRRVQQTRTQPTSTTSNMKVGAGCLLICISKIVISQTVTFDFISDSQLCMCVRDARYDHPREKKLVPASLLS